PFNEHAKLGWEGVYSYGQRVIKMVHLRATGEGLLAPKQIVIEEIPFDLERADSFRQKNHIVAFSAPKKLVKDMAELVEKEKGVLPRKYKMIISSGSSSKEEQQAFVTNCQK